MMLMYMSSCHPREAWMAAMEAGELGDRNSLHLSDKAK